MTESAKQKRRDQIAERAQVAAPKRSQYATYWLTRNRLNGELSSKVDIWLVRPDRLRFADGDVHWLALEPGGESAHYGRWTLAQAHFEVGAGVPETDRECLRVGDDAAAVVEDVAS